MWIALWFTLFNYTVQYRGFPENQPIDLSLYFADKKGVKIYNVIIDVRSISYVYVS